VDTRNGASIFHKSPLLPFCCLLGVWDWNVSFEQEFGFQIYLFILLKKKAFSPFVVVQMRGGTNPCCILPFVSFPRAVVSNVFETHAESHSLFFKNLLACCVQETLSSPLGWVERSQWG